MREADKKVKQNKKINGKGEKEEVRKKNKG